MGSERVLLIYMAVPLVAMAVAGWLDYREFGSGAFKWVGKTEAVVIVGSLLLWPLAAVVIVGGWLFDRRKRHRIHLAAPTTQGVNDGK